MIARHQPFLPHRTTSEVSETIAGIPEALTVPGLSRAPASQLAYDLRTRLAVRGWVRPRALIAADEASNWTPEDVETALGLVVSEVETAVMQHPGCWYLGDTSRRRVLADRNRAMLARELDITRVDSDATDPVRSALQVALGPGPAPPLGTLPSDVLRSLGTVQAMLVPGGPEGTEAVDAGSGRAAIAAELGLREREADLARLTRTPMIGASNAAALDALTEAATEPGQGAAAVYVHGVGGAGKSTVLAHLELRLKALTTPPIVVRIDFDDPQIDPFDIQSMDLAFFEQLGIARPATIPAVASRLQDLNFHRRARRDDRAEFETTKGRKGTHAETFSAVESLGLESVSTQELSGRDSILSGVLDPAQNIVPAGRIVLLLDTVEVVVARGEAAVIEVSRWIGSFSTSLGAPDLRVVIVGRNAPPSEERLDFVQQLQRFGLRLLDTVVLEDLTPDESCALLQALGVASPEVARAAAEVLPGNPLLLHILANVLQTDGTIVADVHAAHLSGRIDRETAQAFLARRMVAHLADPLARPYLLPSMYLPVITDSLLRHVIIPEVDRVLPAFGKPGLHRPFVRETPLVFARRVLAAFSGTPWLCLPVEGGGSVRFLPEIRRLILRLLQDDPEEAALQQAIRERAIDLHAARRTTEDRAYRIYHQMMMSDFTGTVRSPEKIAAILAPVLEDLPDEERAVLTSGFGDRDVTMAPVSEKDWQAYVAAQGLRLVKRGYASEALSLYRSREAPSSVPLPTFYLQALADTGEWDSPDVDLDTLMQEIEGWLGTRRLSNDRLSRLYWVIRLALLRDEGRLSEPHCNILQRACASVQAGSGFSALPALVAVAEAVRAQRTGRFSPIGPDRWITGRAATIVATRLFLVRGLHARQPVALQPRLDALVVMQTDWTARLGRAASDLLHLPNPDMVQGKLNALQGKAFAEVNLTLRALRAEPPVDIHWNAEDPQAGILVLRGQTTEFLRPLSRVLALWLRGTDNPARLTDVLEATLGQMSIRPREFEVAPLLDLLHADPEAWFAALIGYCDRCLLLPALCQALLDMAATIPDGAAIARVARTFFAWDDALCGGGGSVWQPSTPSSRRLSRAAAR